jgi:ribosome-associated protein
MLYYDISQVTFTFIRSSGPGGQNVNKLSTACELRYDINADRILPAYAKEKLMEIAANRISKEGILVITGNQYRTQLQNKQAVLARLEALIMQSKHKPARRIPTRASRSSVEQRIADKKKRGESKNLRRKFFGD